jgi:hypothetical protein
MFLAVETTRSRLLCSTDRTGTAFSAHSCSTTKLIPGSIFHRTYRALQVPSPIDVCFLVVFSAKIAGPYPGVTREEYFAVTSEDTPEPGHWPYDFSDPDGPQLGTVAIESSNVVALADDPVVLIADHFAIGIPLPDVIKDPVDIIVMVDRAATTFAERKFLVLDAPGRGLVIGAFETRETLPQDCEIIGQVVLCQVPWLPSMKPTKTGFLEADEYF